MCISHLQSGRKYPSAFFCHLNYRVYRNGLPFCKTKWDSKRRTQWCKGLGKSLRKDMPTLKAPTVTLLSNQLNGFVLWEWKPFTLYPAHGSMEIHLPVVHPLYKWIVCNYSFSLQWAAFFCLAWAVFPEPLQSAVTVEEAEQDMLYVTTDYHELCEPNPVLVCFGVLNC